MQSVDRIYHFVGSHDPWRVLQIQPPNRVPQDSKVFYCRQCAHCWDRYVPWNGAPADIHTVHKLHLEYIQRWMRAPVDPKPSDKSRSAAAASEAELDSAAPEAIEAHHSGAAEADVDVEVTVDIQ